ncbi:MAG: hypothetical protein GXY44_05620 [Phycisphaerales bacterium]|nr:hypothetical protein [Phycisphaerales bacterium]
MTTKGYQLFENTWEPRARLAWDTLHMRPTKGIPSWLIHVMNIPFMEQITGHRPGDYQRMPDQVYLAFERWAGACYIDQYLADNALTMGQEGYTADTEHGATTGAAEIVLDGMVIDSPEAVAEHLERFVLPRRQQEIDTFDPDNPRHVGHLISQEYQWQVLFGPDLLKGPYTDGFQSFPTLHYESYGYTNYFMAYALFPDIMARDFNQQADLAVLKNRVAARAIIEGHLPRLIRLDHDMADSRSTLVNIKSLDEIWFPQFARSIQPFLDAGIRLIWHCDGNLMDMVPRLLEAGLGGFQGFQYEDGMDYQRICRMTDRNGNPLFIIAGVSVTKTLPFGTKQDVVDQMKWLVQNGPPIGLMLGASSSIVPGTSLENIQALREGLLFFQEHGRT